MKLLRFVVVALAVCVASGCTEASQDAGGISLATTTPQPTSTTTVTTGFVAEKELGEVTYCDQKLGYCATFPSSNPEAGVSSMYYIDDSSGPDQYPVSGTSFIRAERRGETVFCQLLVKVKCPMTGIVAGTEAHETYGIHEVFGFDADTPLETLASCADGEEKNGSKRFGVNGHPAIRSYCILEVSPPLRMDFVVVSVKGHFYELFAISDQGPAQLLEAVLKSFMMGRSS